MKKNIAPWTLVALNAGALFYLSSEPVEKSRETSGQVTDIVMHKIEQIAPNYYDELSYSDIHRKVRKSAHFTLYLMLGYLVSNAYRKNSNDNIAHAFLTCALIAVLDESYQNFVPGRGPEIDDVFIDMLGASTGITLNRFLDSEPKKLLKGGASLSKKQ